VDRSVPDTAATRARVDLDRAVVMGFAGSEQRDDRIRVVTGRWRSGAPPPLKSARSMPVSDAMSTATLRLARTDDAAQIAGIYAPLVRDTAITFELDAPSASQMAQRIADTSLRFAWLVVEERDRLSGFAYAGMHRRRAAYQWSADVSVYVADDARRAGIGRGLYTTLLELLAAQGYANAFAGIALPNEASVRLHEAFGFTPVGVYRAVGYKHGNWWDVGWWQRRLPAIDTAPPPPTRLPELDGGVIAQAMADGQVHIGA
jgi:L-amino acid N-acyltransferase YncA